MSFILDALRKSEHARQRQGGPGLAEVAVAAPKTKTSVWATAAVVLLVANLLAVGVLMLRRAKAPNGAAHEARAASPLRAPACRRIGAARDHHGGRARAVEHGCGRTHANNRRAADAAACGCEQHPAQRRAIHSNTK